MLELLIAALASLVAAGLAQVTRKVYFTLRGIKEEPAKPYSLRLSELTASLTKASSEVDAVLQELARVARDREASVQQLETDLATLESREKELQEKIEVLEKTPIPVADHFARLLEKTDRQSARRDYALFGAGVLVTTIIAVVLQFFTRR